MSAGIRSPMRREDRKRDARARETARKIIESISDGAVETPHRHAAQRGRIRSGLLVEPISLRLTRPLRW